MRSFLSYYLKKIQYMKNGNYFYSSLGASHCYIGEIEEKRHKFSRNWGKFGISSKHFVSVFTEFINDIKHDQKHKRKLPCYK